MITTGRVWPDHVGRMVNVLGDAESSRRDTSRLGPEVMTEHPELINRCWRPLGRGPARPGAMREAQAAGWPVVVVNDPHLARGRPPRPGDSG